MSTYKRCCHETSCWVLLVCDQTQTMYFYEDSTLHASKNRTCLFPTHVDVGQKLPVEMFSSLLTTDLKKTDMSDLYSVRSSGKLKLKGEKETKKSSKKAKKRKQNDEEGGGPLVEELEAPVVDGDRVDLKKAAGDLRHRSH